jgi:hypothetical protein
MHTMYYLQSFVGREDSRYVGVDEWSVFTFNLGEIYHRDVDLCFAI